MAAKLFISKKRKEGRKEENAFVSNAIYCLRAHVRVVVIEATQGELGLLEERVCASVSTRDSFFLSSSFFFL